MHIDKSSFFLALGTIAVGGAAGYVARDHNLIGPAAPPPRPTGMAASLPSAVAPVASGAALEVPPPPACDDATGSPADCPPPPYSAEEGGCAPVANKRCADFKASMKPRVAERAVACIRALNPTQQCDANRVNLCGHVALMNACTVAEPSVAGGATSGDDVTKACRDMLADCPSANLRDCEATLAGMTETGRDRMARCLSAHCADKGLLGCEAVDVK
jgi:hypothetical protein